MKFRVWEVISSNLSSHAALKLNFLGVTELAALKGLLCVPWLKFFLGITWHQMYTTTLQVPAATKFTAIYSIPFLLVFLRCHFLWGEHKLPEFNSWPRVQCISPEIAFSVWGTTAKIAFLELNSYPIQDICSNHISHHTILYYLGHLYFHAPTVTSGKLLCNYALNCVL